MALSVVLAACGGGGGGSDSGMSSSGGSSGGGMPPTPTGPIYVVGSATLPAGATRVASLAAVPWATLPAGSEVLVSPGTWSGVTTITSVGTAAAPIVVTPADTANPPVLSNSVDFQGAAYVQVSHVTVQSPAFAGFVIRLGSNHISVTDATISHAPLGISITDAAGTGHRLLRNLISDSTTHGISVDVNADPAERTLIEHNTIARSGTVAVDGNGIEVDQWCDGNTVAYNVAWGNDGAGIIVFDGSDNVVEGNTAYGNGLDPSRTHVALGQLIVSGTSAATVTGNHVWNNLAASTLAGVPAIYIDSRAVSGGNTVGPNLYANAAGGTLLRWTDSATRQTATLIDATTASVGNVTGVPAFADIANPLADGLRLTAQPAQPARPGTAPAAGDVDFLGTAVQAGWSFLGAYWTSP